jgi:hypothetical protein
LEDSLSYCGLAGTGAAGDSNDKRRWTFGHNKMIIPSLK